MAQIADQKTPVRLLHLSDIHFRESKTWDQDPVMRSLAKSIGSEVAGGMVPDLVIFSGDLAFSGKAVEYEMARSWLTEKLWPALPVGFPRDNFVMVPGNHDVDRGLVSRSAKALQGELLKSWSQETIAEVLASDDDRAVMLRRHQGYLDFVESWYGAPQPNSWWQRTLDIRGTCLHIAGLNTAWMSFGDKDRSQLLAGRYQLAQTIMAEQAVGADWRIAIMHHPWEYLAEFDHDDARSLIHLHCDLLLRGHLHKQRSERVVPPDPARACLELAAGCVYENGRYPNAYQWIELYDDPKRVRVYFRAWLDGAWAIDRNQPNCPQGHAEFELSGMEPPGAPAGTAAPKIPAEYLAWLEKRCASVELLGQDIQKGHAFTLDHVYVPALAPSEPQQPPKKSHRRTVEAAEEKMRPVTLLERLDQTSLYIPAPAGAGKSTFCRWAALQSITDGGVAHPVQAPAEYREPEAKSLQNRLPLLVPLREFYKHMDCGRGQREWQRENLEKALAAWIDEAPPPGLSGGLFRAHLQQGSAFLLLDGLDEVASIESRSGNNVHPRSLIMTGLADALSQWQNAGNRILLTSRPYGLDEAGIARLGLSSAAIEPLPPTLQALFIERWFHTLARPELADDLNHTLQSRAELAPLAENPMLLTAFCVLYDKGGRLSEDRFQLYKDIVSNVLHSRYPEDTRARETALRRLEAIAHGMHIDMTGGTAKRHVPVAETGYVDIERILAGFAETNPAFASGTVEPALQRDDLLARSGLLLPRDNDRAAFFHLSFQEFLAAQRILRTSNDLYPTFRQHGLYPEWRATLLFLFAGQILNRDPDWGLDLIEHLLDENPTANNDVPAPAVLIAELIDLCIAKAYRLSTTLAEKFRCLALKAIDDEIEVHDRQAIALTLGRLGDPRIHDLRDPRAYVELPAGSYASDEKGSTTTIAAALQIGRYPVTNSQYDSFIDDGGYDEARWWSPAGWIWRQQKQIELPKYWHDRGLNGPNQPVVGVSFWEAEACSAWAGGRLPLEAEWRAAAGGSVYPWGDNWRDGICNTHESKLRSTSPVGMFPASRQATLELDDLAGNVWEWSASFYKDTKSDGSRVLRGGSWGGSSDNARCADRDSDSPDVRDNYVGFRVVCLSPILLADP